MPTIDDLMGKMDDMDRKLNNLSGNMLVNGGLGRLLSMDQSAQYFASESARLNKQGMALDEVTLNYLRREGIIHSVYNQQLPRNVKKFRQVYFPEFAVDAYLYGHNMVNGKIVNVGSINRTEMDTLENKYGAFMGAQEVGQRLNLSEMAVNRRSKDHRICAVKYGNSWKVPTQELIYLQQYARMSDKLRNR
jgi:hypothetical protein